MVRVTFSQSGGIYNSYSTVARDLWQRKPPLSSGYALGLGSVYCHKSLAPCYNYNIYIVQYIIMGLLALYGPTLCIQLNYVVAFGPSFFLLSVWSPC